MALLRRRSLLSVLPGSLHPSFSHFLLSSHHHNDETTTTTTTTTNNNNPSSPLHHLSSASTLPPRSHLGWGLTQFASRGYSSSTPGGPHETDYLKDMADPFPEKGGDNLTELLAEKSAESTASAVSEVAAAAVDSAFPVAALQHIIDAVHSFTGLNWWAAIALTTVMIRSATIPLLIHQLKATTKLTLLRPELEAMKEQMQNSMDPNVLQENQRRMKELFKKHGVTPFTPLKGIFIQGPLFISFYLAITNMVQKVPSFKEGGAFWFTDLTTPDPFYLLPIFTGSAFLLTVELNMQEGLEGNPVAGTMKKFSRFFAFLSVPVTASFPKALFCYWITSNLFSLTYGLVIKRPQVKRLLNIPEIPLRRPTTASTSFSFLRTQNQTAQVSSPMTTERSQSSEKRIPSSAVINQRIRNLERTVKGRNKQKKNR